MKTNEVNDRTGLLDDRPEQPTLPDTLTEPITGPETVLDGVREPRSETPIQPALVPMSEDELREAHHAFVTKWRRLREMKARHTKQREEMRAERDQLEAEMDNLERVVREQGR